MFGRGREKREEGWGKNSPGESSTRAGFSASINNGTTGRGGGRRRQRLAQTGAPRITGGFPIRHALGLLSVN